jgi:hypothetical protein
LVILLFLNDQNLASIVQTIKIPLPFINATSLGKYPIKYFAVPDHHVRDAFYWLAMHIFYDSKE